MAESERNLLVHTLTELGHAWSEIQQMVEKLEAHDQRMHREAAFADIAGGDFVPWKMDRSPAGSAAPVLLDVPPKSRLHRVLAPAALA